MVILIIKKNKNNYEGDRAPQSEETCVGAALVRGSTELVHVAGTQDAQDGGGR